MRLRVLDVPVDGLPPELDGLRIAHLSDFHLGVPSRGVRAVERAVAWVEERRPDLVCVTGDLLSRPRGEPLLLGAARAARAPVRRARQPRPGALARSVLAAGRSSARLAHGTLLSDESVEVELRGTSVELAGVDPRSWIDKRPSGFPPSAADLRILLCHFPSALDRVRGGRWNLILAGHLHAGQIVLPYGLGKLLLAHPTARYSAGLYRRGGTAMHVSPGLGTTFVPFRFSARPEATELVLRCSHA